MSNSSNAVTSIGTKSDKISASIEMSPAQLLKMDDLRSIIPAGTRVYITDIGTHDTAAISLGSRKLAELDLIPVPHIAVRRLKNRADLEDRVKRYTDAGVSDILVVGGGPEHAQGDIFSTMEALSTGIFDACGIRDIGVAGHPEGSPDFSDEVALSALRLKQQFSERTDANMRIVTQFGFDPEVFIQWAEGLRGHEIDLPVYLGVAGPAKITTLIKYAAMCGVGNSIDFLKKRANILTTLATSHSPEGVVGPIEAHVNANPTSNIRGIHAFPFGGVNNTARWLANRESWKLTATDSQLANHA